MHTNTLGHDEMELLLLGMAGVNPSEIIEAQERRGQSRIQNSGQLPKDGTSGDDRANFEALGFVFGEDSDDIFVKVQFPEGWHAKPTDHAMWSDIIDNNGNKRAGMFYKAAFYDRSAHIYLSRRYTLDLYSQGHDCKDPKVGYVVDNAGISRIFTAVDPTPGVGKSWDAKDRVQAICLKWIEENYPDYDNVLAYWD